MGPRFEHRPLGPGPGPPHCLSHKNSQKTISTVPTQSAMHTAAASPEQGFCPSRNLGTPVDRDRAQGQSEQPLVLGNHSMCLSLKSLRVGWRSAASLAAGRIRQGRWFLLAAWRSPSASLRAGCGDRPPDTHTHWLGQGRSRRGSRGSG